MKLRWKFLGAMAALLAIAAPAAQAQVVISQVYGGAGCGTAGCFRRPMNPESSGRWMHRFGRWW